MLTPVKIRARGRTLTILAFSDCRVQSLDELVAWVRNYAGPFDLILYGGDDVRRFRPDPDTNYFEQLAAETRYGLCAVAGNDDLPSAREYIGGNKVYDVHRSPLLIGDFCVLGVEGAPTQPDEPGIGFLLLDEAEISRHLRSGKKVAGRRTIIVLSHAPPRGCLDTAVRFGQRQIGSRALATWLRRTRQARLVVCGHVHRCGGLDERFARGWVVNAASHDEAGSPLRVARISFPRAQSTPWIHWVRAREEDQLLRVNGIGGGYAERLAAAGIRSLPALASADPAVVGAAIKWGAPAATVLTVRARALVEKRVIVMRPPRIPPRPRVYFDIETDPAPVSFVWLLGCYAEQTGRFRRFLASRPSGERAMLRQFVAFAQNLSDASWISFSATDFDRRILTERLEHYGLPVPGPLARAVDVQPRMRRAIAIPQESFGLKAVAATFGYEYRHPDLEGLTVALQYLDAVRQRRAVPRRLLAYNRDDVLSLCFAVESVERISPETAQAARSQGP